MVIKTMENEVNVGHKTAHFTEWANNSVRSTATRVLCTAINCIDDFNNEKHDIEPRNLRQCL